MCQVSSSGVKKCDNDEGGQQAGDTGMVTGMVVTDQQPGNTGMEHSQKQVAWAFHPFT